MLIALPFTSDLEGTMPGMQDILSLLEGFIIDNTQLRLVHNNPVGFILVRSLACQEVCDFLLAIDDFSGIQFVSEDMSHGVLAPLAVAFGF